MTNPAQKVERVLRSQGYGSREAKTLISQARAAFQQADEGSATPNSRNQSMSDNTNVAAMIGQINTAFEAFKASHTEEVGKLRDGMDDMATKLAAAQMNGGLGAATPVADGPVAMRTRADFERHYGTPRASDSVSLHDFMRGVAGLKTTDSAINALSVGTDSAGGYAVPKVVMPRILDALVPASALLQAGAGFVPLEEGAKSAMTAVVDTLPAAAWRAELGTVAVSDPTFRGVEAIPRSLACIVKVSRELLADASDMDRALRTAIAQAFAKELDRVGLLGSGTAPEPRGLLNTVGVNVVNSGTNGTALAGYAPILSGIRSILDNNGPMPTAAIMAPRTLVDFGGLEDTTGQPLRAPTLAEGVSIIGTSQVPTNVTVGTSSDASSIFLGDFSRMHFLLRETLSIQLLREAYAGTGELGFLCHMRADVVVPYPQAFAVVKGVRPAA